MNIILSQEFKNPNAQYHLNVVTIHEWNVWAQENGSSMRLTQDPIHGTLVYVNKDKFGSNAPSKEMEQEFNKHMRNVLLFNVELDFVEREYGYGIDIKAVERTKFQTHEELCNLFPDKSFSDSTTCQFGEYTLIRNGWILGTSFYDPEYGAKTRTTVHFGHASNRYDAWSGLAHLSNDTQFIYERLQTRKLNGLPKDILSAALPDVIVENMLLNLQIYKNELLCTNS